MMLYLVHFCAHFGMSYFIASLVYSLFILSKEWDRISLACFTSFIIGYLYKLVEAFIINDPWTIERSLVQNAIGIVFFIALTVRNRK